jgi:hypothetical protein
VTTQTIAVPVIGDTVNEPDETFTVTLSAATNASIVTTTGTGTIVNDDGVSTLSISSPSQAEGNSGTSPMTFVVTLSPASGQTVTVNYATLNGTATAGSDYTATSGTLTFAPSVTTQTIAVPIIGDTVNESDEAFTVTLSAASNASIVTTTGTGTIVNDDGVASPAIAAITPAVGGMTGGQSVTITGTNLGGALSVTFGGIAASVVANTPTSITVTVPAHTAGVVDVVVTTAGGSTTLANAYVFAPATAAAEVPTLSGWMLLVLAAAIALAACVRLRS